MSNGLAIRGLTVRRGARDVLAGLDLAIAPGEVYGLLGHNGAGKSTLLHAVLGLVPIAAGHVSVAGAEPARNPHLVRSRVAYLPETVALYDHLTPLENLRYLLALAGVRPARAALEAALARVGFPQAALRRRLGTASKGMRQKVGIALALLRDVPVLLLDEPTSGLDPGAAGEFHGLLRAVADGDGAGRRAVLMVTHDLIGAARLADRIGLLTGGRLAGEWRAGPGPTRYDIAALHAGFLAT